jgi:hypothetical protein
MSSSFRAAAIFNAPPDLRFVDMYLSAIFNNQLQDNALPIYSTVRLIAINCIQSYFRIKHNSEDVQYGGYVLHSRKGYV